MVVRAYQLVAMSHINQLVYLSGVDQMVATHDGLVLCSGHLGIVVAIHLDQATAVDMEKTSLTQRLANIRIV